MGYDLRAVVRETLQQVNYGEVAQQARNAQTYHALGSTCRIM